MGITLALILFLVIIIIIMYFGIIPLGTCECGGKFRYFFHDSKWGKNVYLCDKCKKTIM